MIIEWLKSLFKEKEQDVPKKVIVKFNSIDMEYSGSLNHCKEHWDYIPICPPTNNCNICWEIYSQKTKNW